MTTDTAGPTETLRPPDEPDRWEDVRRLEEWAGEVRVNLIRLAGIVLFYGRHVIEYALAAPDAKVRGPYHLWVTWTAAVWAVVVVLVRFQLGRRVVPPWLKYATTAADLMLVTLVCVISGGARSPLVLLLFLVVAMAPLRMSLRLVYAATAGAILGYLFLLGFTVWRTGFHRYYSTPELRLPRAEETVHVLALLVAGLLAGQVVRQARRIAGGYGVSVVTEEAA